MVSVRQYLHLVRAKVLINRQMIWFIAMIEIVLSVGLILGFGYFIPHIGKIQALYLTVGAATQTLTTVGLVMLPQIMSQEKAEGVLEYFLTLPVSREAYLLAEVTFVAMVTLPGTVFAVVFGAWHYDLSLTVQPVVVLVAVLAVFSLAGVGVAMAVLSPFEQLTNALTQLIIFYVLLFSPVMMPKQQLPAALQHAATFLPTTYAADAMRAALTDLPGTDLVRSMAVLAGFCIVSLGLSAATIRRRG